jgi:hypothetical protein
VLLRPQKAGDTVKVTDLYPAHLRTTPFVAGVEPHVDRDIRLSTVPLAAGTRLVYRAHDVDGKVRDEFVIEK